MISNDIKVVFKYISLLTKIFQILLLTQMMYNCLRILPKKKKKNLSKNISGSEPQEGNTNYQNISLSLDNSISHV